jgi:hypothetical protein
VRTFAVAVLALLGGEAGQARAGFVGGDHAAVARDGPFWDWLGLGRDAYAPAVLALPDRPDASAKSRLAGLAEDVLRAQGGGTVSPSLASLPLIDPQGGVVTPLGLALCPAGFGPVLGARYYDVVGSSQPVSSFFSFAPRPGVLLMIDR